MMGFLFIDPLAISLPAMALILNIETATTNCSVSLAEDGKLLSIREHNSANYSHSEQLHIFINEVMSETNSSMDKLDAVAVSKGPGSYTGLRIGVSAAKGLCFALDKPLISVSTLSSMARQKVIENGFIIPVLDARRMEVYSAIYSPEYNQVRETQAEVIDQDSFSSYIQQDNIFLIGNGAEKCAQFLSHENVEIDKDIIPSAREMCSLSFQKYSSKRFEDVAYFEPFYLKDFVSFTTKKK